MPMLADSSAAPARLTHGAPGPRREAFAWARAADGVLRRDGVRPPVDFVVEDGTGCHLLEVGAVGVRGVDAFLPGSRSSSGEEDEGHLRAVGRPTDIAQPRAGADGDRNLHQAGTV